MVLGQGRDRSVAAFLRPPTEQAPLLAGAPGRPSRDGLTGLRRPGHLSGASGRRAAAHAGTPGSVAVVLLDLDRFKAINNSMGHALGDGVLASVARRLERVAGDVDLLARFGGDEFLALVTDDAGGAEQKAAAFVARVQEALATPFPVEGAEVFLDASVGVSLNTFGADDPADLLAHAEAAMYQAKRRGGFGVETFGESLRIEVLDRMATEHSLHRALERSELMLHYQPVVEVRGCDHGRRRGPDPVAPPGPGDGLPGPIHPGGRGERTDHPHRGLGTRAGLPPAAGLARPRPGRRRRGPSRSTCRPVRSTTRRSWRTIEEILVPHRASARAPDAGDHRERPDEGRRVRPGRPVGR